RAREHQRNVLAGVAGERRDAIAVREADRQLVGARVELRIGPGAAALVDRDPVRSDPGSVADDLVDGVLVHARNSLMILTDSPGCSQKNRCPAPSRSSTREPGSRAASTSALRSSTTLAAVP